jgi:thiosulfate dehydrogenase
MLRKLIAVILILFLIGIAIYVLNQKGTSKPLPNRPSIAATAGKDSLWIAPDSAQIPHTPEGDLIRYGKDLIANTSNYFGPHGSIAHTANGMNCQNCHLDAGTKAFGNNYSGVFSTYPKYRERRNAIETINQRISDCFQRSLNGHAPDSNGREMKAIFAYMRWLGSNVPKGTKPPGSGILTPKYLDRPADSAKGMIIYIAQCLRCHGAKGEGMLKPDSLHYLYPPLWGDHSYNKGAGLYRLTRFAGYVRDNMPFGASHKATQVTDEEAWDVAAFVNSQPRKSKKFAKDWPDISKKPIDHPFGPYIDQFSERQHKYGPFEPIKRAKDEWDKNKTAKK